MLFSVIFLLNVLVYGGCHLAREEEIVLKKRAKEKLAIGYKGQIIPECPKFTNSKLKKIAVGFRWWIAVGLKKSSTYSGSLANNQYAFLYLHNTDSQSYHIGNKKVNRVFSDQYEDELPYLKKGYWPGDVKNTNFLFGLPLKSAIGKKGNNIGHAEYNLLNQLGQMLMGYLARHKNRCPCFVMLGTVRPPCHYKVGAEPANGCAVDYVTAKKQFVEYCPGTAFCLFVIKPPEQAYQVGWDLTKKLYAKQGIRIITDFTGNQLEMMFLLNRE